MEAKTAVSTQRPDFAKLDPLPLFKVFASPYSTYKVSFTKRVPAIHFELKEI